MSAIKRYYEDLADIVSDAVYEECFDMPEHLVADKAELWEETFRQLMDNPYDVYSYMADILAGRDRSEMPLTVKALDAIEPLVTEYVDRRTA